MKNSIPIVRTCLVVLACLVFHGAAAAQRASIAVVPLENKAQINSVTVDVLTDMLMTAFIKSQKFEVIERDAIKKVMDEQNFAASGAVSGETGAKMGRIQGADYLVLGAVTEAGANTKATAAYGVVTAQSSVTLAIDIRFVDSTTGKTKLAETFRESRGGMSFLTDSSGSVNFAEGPGGEMARELVAKIVAKVLTAVFPPKIIKVDDAEGRVTLNYGEVLMHPGDVWAVYRPGEELIDPDTGESLGSSETKVGHIEITESSAKISHGAIRDGEVSNGDLCRKEARPAASRPQPPRKKVDPF